MLLRVEHVGRLGNQVARQEHAVGHGAQRRPGGLGGGGDVGGDGDALELRLVLLLLRRAVAVEAVALSSGPMAKAAASSGASASAATVASRSVLTSARAAPPAASRPPRRQLAGLAEAHRDELRRAGGGAFRRRGPDGAGLALAALEGGRGQRAGDRAAAGRVDRLGEAREPASSASGSTRAPWRGRAGFTKAMSSMLESLVRVP